MKIPAIVSDRVYVPIFRDLQDMYGELRMKFSHKDPSYYKKRAQGRWVGNMRPHINTWANVVHPDYGDCLSIPRGGTEILRTIAHNFDVSISFVDQRFSLPPITGYENDVVLWPEQQKLVEIMFKTENCLIKSPTGSGKCLSPETKVLRYDGKVVRADRVYRGDYLMGPDSKPRLVMEKTRGYGPMYKITPKKGEPWYCNDEHVLTLVNTTTGNIIDISVNNYLCKSKWFKHIHKLFMTGVNFPIIDELPVDPYFLGIWLGDGRKSLDFIEISKPDIEVKCAMEETAFGWGLKVKTGEYGDKCPAHRIVDRRGGNNRLLKKLRALMEHGIRIPPSYMRNATRASRLQLLAGLIDTDGHQAGGYYEIIQKREALAHDIEFLARSLGFRTTWKEKPVDGNIYYRVNILGEISEIPVRIPRKKAPPCRINKDARRTGFDVEFVGYGDYVGWTLDGDGRFLLGDFTVTHNTEVLLKLAEWILKTAGPVLIIVWEGNRQSGLFKQWVDRICLRYGMHPRDVGMLGDGKKRIAPLTIGMQQTLKNVGRRFIHSFGGIICDEVQRFAAPTFQKVVDIYPARYRFGASADETRNDGKEFLIYDVFGKVAGEVEKATLIGKGKIMPVTIRVVPTGFDYRIQVGDSDISWQDLPSLQKDYNELLDVLTTDKERNDLAWSFIEPCLQDGRTIIVATQRVEHAKYWDRRIRQAGYRSGLMIGTTEYADEFETTKNGLASKKINAGVGTIQKVATGQDIPALDRVFALTPLAKNKQLFEQLTGRLRRTHEGKDAAVLYYFWDQPLYPGHRRRLAKLYPGRTQVLVDGEFLNA